jgi:hypothetical protein
MSAVIGTYIGNISPHIRHRASPAGMSPVMSAP